MPRKKKQQIKTNDNASLEGLLQETYNDACANITAAQSNINSLTKGSEPEDVDDLTKIGKIKNDALKVKESSMKIKLEIAKIQHDTIKHNGSSTDVTDERTGGKVSLSDFKAVRNMLKEAGENNIDDNID